MDAQDPWTEAQWTRVQETVRDEAKKARVAASFMPVQGPLPDDAQTAPLQRLTVRPRPASEPRRRLEINDHDTRRLTTLAVNVGLRGAQVVEPDLSSALVAFRRAANLIARAEDYVVFLGQPGANPAVPGRLAPCVIRGGAQFDGLLPIALKQAQVPVKSQHPVGLVSAVSRAVSHLEQEGHLGPFAVVLGHFLFDAAHSPIGTLVLPSDRIRPLIDGPLLRSSWLSQFSGVPVPHEVPSGLVVSLADDLLDLVVAKEISVRRLQITRDDSPRHLFRVSQRFTVRVKQPTALVALV